MKKEMRRIRQALDSAECDRILFEGAHGVLRLCGEDREPYAVPLSYAYDGENIYFHGAKSGQKLELIAQNPRCSFCVVDMDRIVSEKFTAFFKSVTVTGKIGVVTEEGEKLAAIRKIAKKYSPGETRENTEKEIDSTWGALCVLKLSPENISGKQAIELVKS